jgi:hypothetical protein
VDTPKPDDLAPGELDELLDEAERSIEREGTIPAEEFFREMEQVSLDYRRGKTPADDRPHC